MWWTFALAQAAEFHAVRLTDPDGAPFACVDLETIHHVRFRTDTDGVAAVYEPGLMGQAVWLTPIADTVAAPVDFLGIAGVSVLLDEGGGTALQLQRLAPEGPCDEGDRATRLLAHGVPTAAEHHRFQLLDAATDRPVPAVRLTADGREWWSDNGGNVAFFDLDLMDEIVHFDVWTHGYAPTAVDVVPAEGGVTTVLITRLQRAERLVRLTGGGAWRDTVLLGLPTPSAAPLLDGLVLGQDTAHAVPWRGGLFWLWGDTNKPSYPLGSFRASGATAALDPTPEDGVDLVYYTDATGFSKGIAPNYPEGPVWLGGLVALSDDELWATFVNVRSDFSIIESGMARWDDDTERFAVEFEFADRDIVRPDGPAILVDGSDGEWVMYRKLTRAPATAEALDDPSTYEAYTPLVPDESGGYTVATTPDGVPDWRWRKDAPWPEPGALPELDSPWERTLEPYTGETPSLHNGSIAWNASRGRWIHVFTESFGASSLIGEIWYAEGDTPVGPWSWARKIVTHDGYSFYNPYLHPWFDQPGRVLFEATYTGWLGSQPLTPRHDYNQLLYALDLPGLDLPVPFYAGPAGPVSRHDADDDAPVWFGAVDPAFGGEGLVPVVWSAPDCAPDRALTTEGPGELAFYAQPAGADGPELVDLVQTATGYALGGEGTPVAAVWSPRWTPAVPLSLYPLADRADAGPDQCGSSPEVTLDASASRSREPITDYTWSWDGGSATGQVATVSLPPGRHVITLAATTATATLTDTVFVEAAADGDEPPPVSGPGTCGCDGGAGGAPLLWVALVYRRRRSAKSASAPSHPTEPVDAHPQVGSGTSSSG